jgi:hypothetical protein
MIVSGVRIDKMKAKILCLILFLLISHNLSAQDEKKEIWNYKDLTFNEFVIRAEAIYNVKFFYKDEWVKDLKPSNYQGSFLLSELLDKLFNGTSLFYFIDSAGNVIITRNFAVKVSDKTDTADKNFIPPADYNNADDNRQL